MQGKTHTSNSVNSTPVSLFLITYLPMPNTNNANRYISIENKSLSASVNSKTLQSILCKIKEYLFIQDKIIAHKKMSNPYSYDCS